MVVTLGVEGSDCKGAGEGLLGCYNVLLLDLVVGYTVVFSMWKFIDMYTYGMWICLYIYSIRAIVLNWG